MQSNPLKNQEKPARSSTLRRNLLITLALLLSIAGQSFLRPQKTTLQFERDLLRISTSEHPDLEIPYRNILSVTWIEEPDFGAFTEDTKDILLYGTWEDDNGTSTVSVTPGLPCIAIDTIHGRYMINAESRDKTEKAFEFLGSLFAPT